MDIESLPNTAPSEQLIQNSKIQAKSSSSRLEFKKFYEIALRRANETKYWLGLLRDSNLADAEDVNKLLAEITEISKMLASSVIKLKTKK